MKKLDYIYYTLFILYSFICFKHGISFEVGWNERFELFDAEFELDSHFELPYNRELLSSASDRGLLFPLISKFFLRYISPEIIYLRVLTISLYLGCLHLMYFSFIKSPTREEKFLSVLFLATNYTFYFYSNVISPYAFNTLIILIFYKIHFNFSGTRRDHIHHAILSLAALLSFFTSAIPVFISIFILLKFKKLKIKKYFTLYIPVLVYTIFKLLLIIYFRVLDDINPSGSSVYSFADALQRLFKFLNVFPSTNLDNLYILFLSLPIFYILIKFCLFIYHSKTSLSLFVKHYSICMILSYFLMISINLREAEVRYYINFLPLFYLSFSIFFINFIKRHKVIGLAIIISITSVTIINIRHFGRKKYIPSLSIANYIFPRHSSKDLICSPHNFVSENQNWRLGVSWKYKGLYSPEDFRNVTRCSRKIKKWKIDDNNKIDSIYIITFKRKFNKNMFCNDKSSKFCENKYFIEDLMNRKEVSYFRIPSYQKNIEVYISEYKKK